MCLEQKDEALHEYLFWEMENQTAVRKGRYKLVINGRLEEKAEAETEFFLSDLEADPGETNNLADILPEILEELTEASLNWRKGIEETWETKFLKNYTKNFFFIHIHIKCRNITSSI